MVIEIINQCFKCGDVTKHTLPPRAKKFRAKCGNCGRVEVIIIERGSDK